MNQRMAFVVVIDDWARGEAPQALEDRLKALIGTAGWRVRHVALTGSTQLDAWGKIAEALTPR